MTSIHKGFDTNMAFWIDSAPNNINVLFTRGGLYELNEAIIFSIMVFLVLIDVQIIF